MKKTALLLAALYLIATTAAAEMFTIDPLRYDGGDREYKLLMEFINAQIEERGLSGTEMVAERKKQQRAFIALSRGERRQVKKAMRAICTENECDYAEALFEYQRIMDQQ